MKKFFMLCVIWIVAMCYGATLKGGIEKEAYKTLFLGTCSLGYIYLAFIGEE